jgi:hypothetical protein
MSAPSPSVPTHLQVRALNCPSCGAALEIRAFAHTLSVVCPQCLSVLDAKHPDLRILQKFKSKERYTLLVPLGARGKWQGDIYQVIGFQVREIHADGQAYHWGEYLLFNPYRGFRYLTEYQGHWNDVRTLRALPEPARTMTKPAVKYLARTYTHFQTAKAKTVFVMGEFPWRVQVGETVTAKDYIAPPQMLSAEETEAETVWSVGEYTKGEEIWRAFQLPGKAPQPVGIFANQPSPAVERSKGIWNVCATLLLLTLAVALFGYTVQANEEVFRQRFRFSPGVAGEASFVTNVFELRGRPSNVEIETRTDLSNNWAYFSFALINDVTGQAYDFGREVSYYSGRDSDGSWSEGSSHDRAVVPSVPAGRYYLRVEPEMAPNARAMSYELRVRRDVPRSSFFWITAVLLLIPPIIVTLRRTSFEHRRWQESDYGTSSSSADDD